MEIIHAECLSILRGMPAKSVDLVCTDPPYGIGIMRGGHIGGGGQSFKEKAWDGGAPDHRYFDEMRRVARAQIIWGGNYFSDVLPPSRGWLVWWKIDGLPTGSFSDCELAWTSFDMPAQVMNSRWRGFVRDSKETRYPHPTQKSLEVMKWCVSTFSKPGDTVLDPFAGTGTTGVACALLKRTFIGIEQDREYVAIARERVLRAQFDLT